MITHSAKGTKQQKERLGWRLEVTGMWGRVGWTTFEKGGGMGGGKQYRGIFIKREVRIPLPTM